MHHTTATLKNITCTAPGRLTCEFLFARLGDCCGQYARIDVPHALAPKDIFERVGEPIGFLVFVEPGDFKIGGDGPRLEDLRAEALRLPAVAAGEFPRLVRELLAEAGELREALDANEIERGPVGEVTAHDHVASALGLMREAADVLSRPYIMNAHPDVHVRLVELEHENGTLRARLAASEQAHQATLDASTRMAHSARLTAARTASDATAAIHAALEKHALALEGFLRSADAVDNPTHYVRERAMCELLQNIVAVWPHVDVLALEEIATGMIAWSPEDLRLDRAEAEAIKRAEDDAIEGARPDTWNDLAANVRQIVRTAAEKNEITGRVASRLHSAIDALDADSGREWRINLGDTILDLASEKPAGLTRDLVVRLQSLISTAPSEPQIGGRS